MTATPVFDDDNMGMIAMMMRLVMVTYVSLEHDVGYCDACNVSGDTYE
jgi:hypothetical protein